jgi:hypothetical protein
MVITNTTSTAYWFGPMYLPAGNGSTLTIDDTTDTGLYLVDDAVADAVNFLALSGEITVAPGTNSPYPRATGVPSLLHGDGSPQGKVYAPQGSLYMRRDTTGAATSLYSKTTGVSLNVGWVAISEAATSPVLNSANNTAAETDLFGAAGSGFTVPAGALGLNGALRLTLGCDLLCNAAINSTLKVYYGSTVLYNSGAVSITNSATHRAFNLTLLLQNQGATNAQWMNGWASLGTTGAPTTGLGAPLAGSAADGDAFATSVAVSPAVDSTQNQNFRVTWTWSAANAAGVILTKTALIELL